MPVPADTLRIHLDYSAWATRRLLQAAAGISAEELRRDFSTADKSVLGTLRHIFKWDRNWLARLQGQALEPSPEDAGLAALEAGWLAVHARWKDWAAGLTAESALAPVAWRDSRGREHCAPAWLLVMHVVNHATHHRGQVSGFLRAMGQAPPPLDLLFYWLSA